MLSKLETVVQLVESGKSLILAGDEALLREVPSGKWIGGTIPYFMTEAGGIATRESIFVQEVPESAVGTRIDTYTEQGIANVANHGSDNGYTVLIIPAFSAIHEKYALEAASYEDMFLKVVTGWISGILLDEIGKSSPRVFDGRTGAVYGDRAVAMHIDLPPNQHAQLGIVNIFEPDDGDELQFERNGFSTVECLVNGQRLNFLEYIQTHGIDTRLPLIANYMGTGVNVSIQSADAGIVKFYAPVFAGIKYRLAKPIGNYSDCFSSAIPAGLREPAFSCNCILNYLYGNLENRRTSTITGPMTFGEIGYQLLNQTLIYVSILMS